MRLPATILAAAAVTGSALIATPPVFAAACAPRDEFAKHLATNYKEESQSIGITNDGSLFEVFASDNGSWSLLVTNGRKISCIVAAGEMWVMKRALIPEAKLEH